MLINATGDYMRGFQLLHAQRSTEALTAATVDDPLDAQYPSDGRIAPVARLGKLFFDAIESGTVARPGFAEGFRVQQLIDAAQRANRDGVTVDVAERGA
jgi:predicted dehydrogenase